MIAKTWTPGTDKDLDSLFEELRQIQFNDKSHRYWQNYSVDFLQHTVAHTIYFDENNEPELCSSIAQRDCWPDLAYRVLNRTWKVKTKKPFFSRTVSPSFGMSVLSQREWLATNTNCELYFISRQTNHWGEFLTEYFSKYGINWSGNDNKYLSCPNECDQTCWQKILYIGNEEILKSWKHL